MSAIKIIDVRNHNPMFLNKNMTIFEHFLASPVRLTSGITENAS